VTCEASGILHLVAPGDIEPIHVEAFDTGVRSMLFRRERQPTARWRPSPCPVR
jgi:hypothetical protein